MCKENSNWGDRLSRGNKMEQRARMRKGERGREGGRDFKSCEIIAPQTLKRCAEAWPFLAVHPIASDKTDNGLFS